VINNFKISTVLLILITSALFSCGESEEVNENLDPDNQSNLLNSKINVSVSVCENLFCTQINTLSNIEVNLKRDDAEPFYKSGITDEFGELSFTSLNVSPLTVLASYNGQEFEEKVSVGRNQVLHIEIIFSPFCELDGPRLVNCNKKIDFEHMSIGQVSKYAMYKTNVKQLNDDKSFYYTGDTLVLEVVEHIGDNRWNIKEEFASETNDSLFEYIIRTKSRVCTWEVQEDYMKIYPLTLDEYSNFTPYLSFDHDTYQIPFVAEGSNYCEMDQWYTLNCDYEGTPRIVGFEVNGKKYDEELILDRRSGIDIPLLGVFYNKEEGIVHTYTFGTLQYTYAYGFDLIH